MAGRGKAPVEFGDGVLTCRGTFQKFYEQDELKAFLESQLETEAIPAGIGVFYLFKDEGRRQQFLSQRFRRRETLPRKRIADTRYQENRELLDALMEAVASYGRLPEPDEFTRSQEVADRFGTLRRAFAVIRHITGGDEWEQITKRRAEDMLVYLALARFRQRPAFSLLPRTLQLDVKAFFGAYTKAC
jgi:DNA phosphorothioation-associated putative methyltransferase